MELLVVLPYVQIVLSALLVAAILLQRTGASLEALSELTTSALVFTPAEVWRGTSSMPQ